MARWLGIESPKSVAKTNNQTLPELESKQSNLSKKTAEESIINEPTSIDGISNCETAMTTPSVSPKLEAHSIQVIGNRADLDLEPQKENSELKLVEKVEIAQMAEIELADEVEQTKVEAEENWQPDLSGWSVFKGLST